MDTTIHEIVTTPCLLVPVILGLTVALFVLRQYLLIAAGLVIAIAAMFLPGGIAVIVGVIVLAVVWVLRKHGGIHITVNGNNNKVTAIIDNSKGAGDA